MKIISQIVLLSSIISIGVSGCHNNQKPLQESTEVDLMSTTFNLERQKHPVFSNKLKFENFTVEDGLASNTILCIHADRRGYLWIATEAGLNRYDGYDFHTYKHDPEDSSSLPNDVIYEIEEDARGNIWLMSLGFGIARYDYQSDSFVSYLEPFMTNLPSYQYSTIEIDAQDRVWYNRPLSYYSPEQDKFIQFSSELPLDLFQDKHQRLYAIFHTGQLEADRTRHIAYLDNESFSFKEKYVDTTGIRIQPSNGWSLDAESNIIYFATQDNSLNYYDVDKNIFGQFENSSGLIGKTIKGIHFDKNSGDLWLACWRGLVRTSVAKGTTNKIKRYLSDEGDTYSLPQTITTAVTQDQFGNLWIGSAKGLSKAAPSSNKFEHHYRKISHKNSLQSNEVESLLEDSHGQIWIGTQNGLHLMDREAGTFRVFDNPDTFSCNYNWVKDIFEDKASGLLYISYWGAGLNRFNPREKMFQPIRPSNIDVENIDEKCWQFYGNSQINENGEILISPFGGGCFKKFNPKTNRLEQYIGNPKAVDFLSSRGSRGFIDSNGLLWLGNLEGKGLQVVDFSKGQSCCMYDFQQTSDGVPIEIPFRGTVTNFLPETDDSTQLRSGTVYSFLESADKTLWIGTAQGLHRFSRSTNDFRRFDHLPFADLSIRGIIEDQNRNLWLSTNNGLYQFSPYSGEVLAHYTKADGLQSNLFNQGACHLMKSGEILLGGPNGFNIFHPDSTFFNPQPPRADALNSQHLFSVFVRHRTFISFSFNTNFLWVIFQQTQGEA